MKILYYYTCKGLLKLVYTANGERTGLRLKIPRNVTMNAFQLQISIVTDYLNDTMALPSFVFLERNIVQKPIVLPCTPLLKTGIIMYTSVQYKTNKLEKKNVTRNVCFCCTKGK